MKKCIKQQLILSHSILVFYRKFKLKKTVWLFQNNKLFWSKIWLKISSKINQVLELT